MSDVQNLVTLTIDGVEVSVPEGTLVIRAAEQAGIEIPRFCDHPLLEPVGACRQCLVDVPDAGNGRSMGKPQASCTIPVAPGMVVHTQETSPVAAKAQQGVMEFLLINHPLDCPVCDKGGECPLQNQAMTNGQAESRFVGNVKREFPKPISISPQVLLDRERCVLCARCTRYADQISGDPFIALLDRGALQQVGIFEEQPYLSYFSGNAIQICPVGALTSTDYRFRSRPFDLVSTPSVAAIDACGAAIRVDHRRGKVMRQLSGNDPEVNEEWISDKDRFAFLSSRRDRITTPLIRVDGELRPASWPEAFAVAAKGLVAAGSVGVLPGGRLPLEDAYAYAKFARVAVGSNDIDFRARPHSAEEAEFLAAAVAAGTGVTYADLDAAKQVVLVALEPEDEAGTLFLRLRKAYQERGLRIVALSALTTPGLRKLGAEVVATVPGAEVAALRRLATDADTVVLVGERAAMVPGLLSAVVDVVATSDAKLAWVPRRAGDRGAVEAGCLPTLLPGGRPASAAARAELAALWGAPLPEGEGRDLDRIVSAAASGSIQALVVGGVDVRDLTLTDVVNAALHKAFVVSLEVRESAVTEAADVVFPVAPSAERSGTYLTWEGRSRAFPQVFDVSGSVPDLRVLAGIAEQMGRPLGWRSTDEVAAEIARLGEWTGPRAEAPSVVARSSSRSSLVLSSWKQLIDDGRMQDGAEALRACARPAQVLVTASLLAGLGVSEGDDVVLTGPRGSLRMPVGVDDSLADGVVWAPASAPGYPVRSAVGRSGDAVSVTAGGVA